MLDLHQPAQAEQFARPALAVLESKWGSDKDWTMLAAYALGRALLDEGEPAEAATFLKRSADTYEKLYSRGEGIAIYARYYLGLAQIAQGDKQGEALVETSVEEATKYENPSGHLIGRPLQEAIGGLAAKRQR